MGLINKIREKSGIAVGIIAIGLGLFVVGGDILSPNSTLLGGDKTIVGEIAGREISYQEYVNEIEEYKYNFSQNTGRNPSEIDMYTVREQAWLSLIAKYAFQKEFDKLGIQVTDEEIIDMVQGNNISPELMQMATNPETGQFDKSFITGYLQNLSSLPVDAQIAWYNFERNLAPGRLRVKYDKLITDTYYVTSAEARREHVLQNTVADVKYLYIPYYSVSDSLVSVTDAELTTYMKNNPERYKTPETRSIDFVTFPLIASAKDSAIYREDIIALRDELARTDSDSTFARLNTEGALSYGTYTEAQLPQSLEGLDLQEGQVFGPFVFNGFYEVHKISEVQTDGTKSARASHILFRTNNGENTAEKRREAEEVLTQIRGGADFATMAREYSDDTSGAEGGDLGWFSDGGMIAPFNDAVFAQSNTGLIPRLIESEFGFHIINVTEAPTSLNYKIASIQISIDATDETRDNAFRDAGRFSSRVGNYDQFKAIANENNYAIYEAFDITNSDRSINILNNAREVVRWLFNDAKIGSLSEVFELDNQYVVAIMTGRTAEGIVPLEYARADVEQRVKNEKKTKIIQDRLATLTGSLEQIRDAYGPDARAEINASLTLNGNTLGLFGSAPTAIGRAFGLKAGERTKPIGEASGVFVIEVNSITNAPEITELGIYGDILRQRYPDRAGFAINEAIREFANIKDYRYKFF